MLRGPLAGCARGALTLPTWTATRFRTTRLAVAALALAGGLVVITACGDDDDMRDTQPGATTTATEQMTESSMMTEPSTP